MPNSPTGIDTTKTVLVPQTTTHPAYLKYERYRIGTPAEGALVEIGLQGHDDAGNWDTETAMVEVRIEDFAEVDVPAVNIPAQGTEGEDGFVPAIDIPARVVPAHSKVTLGPNTYQFDNVHVAQDCMDMRLGAIVADTPTAQTYAAQNLPVVGMGLEVLAHIQQLIAARG